MVDLKVGDNVRVIGNISDHEFNIGEVVECLKLEFDGIHKFKCEDGISWYMKDGDYEILPKFKIGDKVRLNTNLTTDDYFMIVKNMIDDYDVLTISSIGNNFTDGFIDEIEIKVLENGYSYHPSWLELVDDEQEEKGYTTITAVHFGNYGEYTWICDRELFEDIKLLDLVLVDTVKGEQVVQVVKKSEILDIKDIHKKVIKKLEVY